MILIWITLSSLLLQILVITDQSVQSLSQSSPPTITTQFLVELKFDRLEFKKKYLMMKRNNKASCNESHHQQKNLNENAQNTFDERRVQVLKARIIQLERQNQLFLDSIGKRAASFEYVDGILTSVANCCRKYIAKKDCPGKEVNVERVDLISCVTQLETARRKMYHLDNKMSDVGNLRPALLQECFMSNDESNKPTTSASLLDASTGNLQHLNLKFVAKLESQLSSLLRELIQLQHCLEDHINISSISMSAPIASKDFLVARVKQHEKQQIEKCCQLLETSSEQLMDLSMIHPSAPWGPLRKPLFQNEVTVEQVMATFPRSLSKNTKVRTTIEALMKAVNHKQLMYQKQIQALKAELNFHRDVYTLQISYTNSLMESLKKGYKKFQSSTGETVFIPLKDVLGAFSKLKTNGDEESWTNFLSVFKLHADTLEKSMKWMSEYHSQSKEVVLDDYLSDFYSALSQLEQANQNQKHESTKLRSDQLMKQQKLEDALCEYLSLKDQNPDDALATAMTLETSPSTNDNSSLFQFENPKLSTFPSQNQSSRNSKGSIKHKKKT